MATKNTKTNEQTVAEAVKETADTTNTANEAAGQEVPKPTTEVDTVETAAPAKEKIFIPRGSSNDDPNFFVSVNGVNYLLPRGKESEVPAHIAAEIRRSWKAQDRLDEHKDELLNAAK